MGQGFSLIVSKEMVAGTHYAVKIKVNGRSVVIPVTATTIMAPNVAPVIGEYHFSFNEKSGKWTANIQMKISDLGVFVYGIIYDFQLAEGVKCEDANLLFQAYLNHSAEISVLGPAPGPASGPDDGVGFASAAKETAAEAVAKESPVEEVAKAKAEAAAKKVAEEKAAAEEAAKTKAEAADKAKAEAATEEAANEAVTEEATTAAPKKANTGSWEEAAQVCQVNWSGGVIIQKCLNDDICANVSQVDIHSHKYIQIRAFAKKACDALIAFRESQKANPFAGLSDPKKLGGLKKAEKDASQAFLKCKEDGDRLRKRLKWLEYVKNILKMSENDTIGTLVVFLMSGVDWIILKAFEECKKIIQEQGCKILLPMSFESFKDLVKANDLSVREASSDLSREDEVEYSEESGRVVLRPGGSTIETIQEQVSNVSSSTQCVYGKKCFHLLSACVDPGHSGAKCAFWHPPEEVREASAAVCKEISKFAKSDKPWMGICSFGENCIHILKKGNCRFGHPSV